MGFFRLRLKEERIAKEKERRRSISAGAVTATVVPPNSAHEDVDLDTKPEAVNNNVDKKPEPETVSERQFLYSGIFSWVQISVELPRSPSEDIFAVLIFVPSINLSSSAWLTFLLHSWFLFL